ncbi:DUF3095 domain-containing protein [Phormidium tenue FACHB-886]|nr:DUF3095 domain-containing protein [Phormidium tenue FACHB-886]
MTLDNFYTKLPTLSSFVDVANSEKFVSVPDEWYIIVTDITGSTAAIESGHYKDVNLLGACSIIAVLNVANRGANKIEIPFIFGGDGATILIPPSLLSKSRKALLATRLLASKEFGMDLRIGIVPVKDVITAHYNVKVAKIRVSQHYSQAAFWGGGLSFATELVKDPSANNSYRLDMMDPSLSVDLSGLECRWRDIRSRHGETVSLIILASVNDTQSSNTIYKEVIEKIQSIYGDDANYHPVLTTKLRLTFNRNNLLKETKARSKSKSWQAKCLHLWRIKLENALGLVLMELKVKSEQVDWGIYKKIVADATDYRKFDDMLRMVISGNAIQREMLIQYLEDKYKKGKLVYGLHVSNRALMTCFVFDRNGPQVHFIDGADGGYTLAAKEMKEKMRRKAINWPTFVRMVERHRKLSD